MIIRAVKVRSLTIMCVGTAGLVLDGTWGPPGVGVKIRSVCCVEDGESVGDVGKEGSVEDW